VERFNVMGQSGQSVMFRSKNNKQLNTGMPMTVVYEHAALYKTRKGKTKHRCKNNMFL